MLNKFLTLYLISLNLTIATAINLNNDDDKTSYALGFIAGEHLKSQTSLGFNVSSDVFIQGFKDNMENKPQINKEEVIKYLNIIRDKQIQSIGKNPNNNPAATPATTPSNNQLIIKNPNNSQANVPNPPPAPSAPVEKNPTPTGSNQITPTTKPESTNTSKVTPENLPKNNEVASVNSAISAMQVIAEKNQTLPAKAAAAPTSNKPELSKPNKVEPKKEENKEKNNSANKIDKTTTANNKIIQELKQNLENKLNNEPPKTSDFLAINKQNQEVQELKSGLQYQVVAAGNQKARSPALTDKVKVHYRGTLVNGKEFDSSYKRQPAVFELRSVIKGWQEALILMKPNAKWKIFVPPHLAYGSQGSGIIPPNSVLIFDVELLEVNPQK